MKGKLIILLIIMSLQTFASQKPLHIGDKIPMDIWRNIPKDPSSKIIILDFWATSCSNCIAAFPKMEDFQKQYSPDLQIVLINSVETDDQISKRFSEVNKYRRQSNLNLIKLPSSIPAINNAKEFQQIFPHNSVPQHVWLNAEGRVLAIAEGAYTIPENIKNALNTGHLDLPLKDDNDKDNRRSVLKSRGPLQPTLSDLPLAVYSGFMQGSLNSYSAYYFDSSGKTDFFRWGEFEDEFKDWVNIVFPVDQKNNMHTYNDRLPIINESVDSNVRIAMLRPSDITQRVNWETKYLFSYFSQGYKKDKDKWKVTLQEDMERYFGNLWGIQIKLEKRKFNTLVLKSTSNNLLDAANDKISTKYYGPGEEGYKAGEGIKFLTCQFKNILITFFKSRLANYLLNCQFVDETSIDKEYKVDFILNGNMDDVSNIKEQIKKYGLYWAIEEREFDAVVISNIKNNKR